MKKIMLVLLVGALCGIAGAENLGPYALYAPDGRSVVIATSSGQHVRVTPYSDYMIRIQAVRQNESFAPDSLYEMVESHAMGGSLTTAETDSTIEFSTASGSGARVVFVKSSMAFRFAPFAGNTLFSTIGSVGWNSGTITVNFAPDNTEHFCGLGHGRFGAMNSIDLKGQTINRTYGSQAPLIVPFYMSSKGYGLFVNTTFASTFTFGASNTYRIAIDNGFIETTTALSARFDVFLIAGPTLPEILDHYTQLTGRPRLPQKSMFGWQLSDKGHPGNNGEPWWKDKITTHRDAGYPFDVVINDNSWRAGGGGPSGSRFEFDLTKYPDPAEYKRWCDSMGVTVSLDLNRNNVDECANWLSSYSIPGAPDAPDYTSKATRDWLWNLFWTQAFDPAKHYPGDALWLDEVDDMQFAGTTLLANGRPWSEMSNYYFYLVAKAAGREGWDPHIGAAKRPFIWQRGGTAGGQRYSTMWSGDISSSYGDMKTQEKAMLAAGLSGFPYFNHDAGGYSQGPSDSMYAQWSMAFGSFTPIWRPHGTGSSRWPLDRPAYDQAIAHTYADLRYALMPYLYTYAYRAYKTGQPMARAMCFDHQDQAAAWSADFQYLWGKELLVAPIFTNSDTTVSVWFPNGGWYDLWTDSLVSNGGTKNVVARFGTMPIFVKKGAILPSAPAALSTFKIKRDSLVLDIYTGADGAFTLYDDDGVTEAYRSGDSMITPIEFTDAGLSLRIGPSTGTYNGAPASRAYRANFHGLSAPVTLNVDGRPLASYASLSLAQAAGEGQIWDASRRVLTAIVATTSIGQQVQISGTPTKAGNQGSLAQAMARVQLSVQKRLITAVSGLPLTIDVYTLQGRRIAHSMSNMGGRIGLLLPGFSGPAIIKIRTRYSTTVRQLEVL